MFAVAFTYQFVERAGNVAFALAEIVKGKKRETKGEAGGPYVV